MKYHKMNLELFQTRSLQYQYNLPSHDQHPVHTVHRPVLLRPVHKETSTNTSSEDEPADNDDEHGERRIWPSNTKCTKS